MGGTLVAMISVLCDRIGSSGRNRIAMIWPELESDCYPKSGQIRPDWPDLTGFDKVLMLDFKIV